MITKKNFLVIYILLSLASQLRAQPAFNTIDSIDINNINASILVHGDMWWNPDSQNAHAYFPKNSKASINFASSLWISGFDAGNNLHISAQTYRQNGSDYWPGPLTSSGTLTYTTSSDWSKIWKVNRSDIQYFLSLSTHTITNTPASILRWPGKGNSNAQGKGGVALTVTNNMAPFADLNSNGNYEPLLGEYPDITGDQALWWIFSDNGPSHGETNGMPLGIEVHAMAYGYSRGTLIDNVVYYDFNVINRSSNNYHDVRLSLFDAVDLGFWRDDYIGFDSTWRMGICYNGHNDDGASGGHPANSYGTSVPIVGVTMIVLPGDVGTSYVPAGSFTYYNNDNSIIGNPTVDTQYNNYMRARLRNGQNFKKEPYSPGTPCNGYSSGPNTNYVYTGDPSINTQWSECACNNPVDDRRFILSSNDFTLNSGSSQHMVMAMVVTDTGEGGCGKPVSFNNIKIAADTAWKIYHNPLLPNSMVDPSVYGGLHIYPNPAKNKLFIEYAPVTPYEESLTIYNVLGQVTNVSITKDGKRYEVDIAGLPAGLYNVLYRSGDTYTTAKFVKE